MLARPQRTHVVPGPWPRRVFLGARQYFNQYLGEHRRINNKQCAMNATPAVITETCTCTCNEYIGPQWLNEYIGPQWLDNGKHDQYCISSLLETRWPPMARRIHVYHFNLSLAQAA
jgi:hypothetical protein